GGTLVQPPRPNSVLEGHKSSPRTLDPEPLPEPGSWGISLRSAQLRSSTGSRYTLTVSTGTSTNVMGEKHLAATVTVRVGPRSASLNTATPRESANVTSLLSPP